MANFTAVSADSWKRIDEVADLVRELIDAIRERQTILGDALMSQEAAWDRIDDHDFWWDGDNGILSWINDNASSFVKCGDTSGTLYANGVEDLHGETSSPVDIIHWDSDTIWEFATGGGGTAPPRYRTHPTDGGSISYADPSAWDILDYWLIDAAQKALTAMRWTEHGLASHLDDLPAHPLNETFTNGDPDADLATAKSSFESQWPERETRDVDARPLAWTAIHRNPAPDPDVYGVSGRREHNWLHSHKATTRLAACKLSFFVSFTTITQVGSPTVFDDQGDTDYDGNAITEAELCLWEHDISVAAANTLEWATKPLGKLSSNRPPNYPAAPPPYVSNFAGWGAGGGGTVANYEESLDYLTIA